MPYIELIMDICKVKLPDLEYSLVKPDSEGEVFFSRHGYGIFD